MPPLEKPKIAICLEYPALGFGGVEVLVAELVRRLSTHYGIVLVSKDETAAVAGSALAACITEHFSLCGYSPIQKCGRPLAEFLKRANTDLAHFHFGSSYSWGARWWNQSPVMEVSRAGIIVVSTIHQTVSILQGYCGPQKPLWFKLALLPVAWVSKLHELARQRVVLSVSRSGVAKISRWFWPLRRRFRHVYHSRLELENLPAPNALRKHVVLCVGYLAALKGQTILAAAFGKIALRFSDWQLHFAGSVAEPEYGREITRFIADSGLSPQIQLLGPRTDAMELMKNSAIFVQASFFEGLPLALQEAMFNGCACIASRIDGNDELIADGENGLLFPAGDIDALAGTLERLMRDAPLRQSLSESASCSIVDRGMTAEAMVQAHRDLYESLLAQRG